MKLPPHIPQPSMEQVRQGLAKYTGQNVHYGFHMGGLQYVFDLPVPVVEYIQHLERRIEELS